MIYLVQNLKFLAPVIHWILGNQHCICLLSNNSHSNVITFTAWTKCRDFSINPLNAQLNPICHLLALLGTHHILHVSRIRVKHLRYVY
jgi:hypothetical protein